MCFIHLKASSGSLHFFNQGYKTPFWNSLHIFVPTNTYVCPVTFSAQSIQIKRVKADTENTSNYILYILKLLLTTIDFIDPSNKSRKRVSHQNDDGNITCRTYLMMMMCLYLSIYIYIYGWLLAMCLCVYSERFEIRKKEIDWIQSFWFIYRRLDCCSRLMAEQLSKLFVRCLDERTHTIYI